MKTEDSIQIEVMENGFVVYVNKYEEEGRRSIVFLTVDEVIKFVTKTLKGEEN